MPQASHRLNLLLVAPLGSAPPPGLEALLEEARRDPEAVIPGGFALIRLDRPPRPTLYGNRQGGYHADCGRCGKPLAKALSRAVEELRAGEPWSLTCPSCGALQPGDLRFSPPAALGPYAVELRDVEGLELRPAWAERLRGFLGPLSAVGSRG